MKLEWTQASEYARDGRTPGAENMFRTQGNNL